MKDVSPRTWLRKLLSGEVERCMWKLGADAGSRCCLGVLRDLNEIPLEDTASDLDDFYEWFGADEPPETCRPKWMSSRAMIDLLNANDCGEQTPGVWEKDGPVAEIIRERLIPRYDELRKGEK